jgi:hypothetical protein
MKIYDHHNVFQAWIVVVSLNPYMGGNISLEHVLCPGMLRAVPYRQLDNQWLPKHNAQ